MSHVNFAVCMASAQKATQKVLQRAAEFAHCSERKKVSENTVTVFKISGNEWTWLFLLTHFGGFFNGTYFLNRFSIRIFFPLPKSLPIFRAPQQSKMFGFHLDKFLLTYFFLGQSFFGRLLLLENTLERESVSDSTSLHYGKKSCEKYVLCRNM